MARLVEVNKEKLAAAMEDGEEKLPASMYDAEKLQVPMELYNKVRVRLGYDDVKQFVAKEVIHYKKIREVIFVHKIPKAPSGKILRKELRKQLQQQHPQVL